MDSASRNGKAEFVSWILPPPGCFAKEIHFKGSYGPKSIRDRFHWSCEANGGRGLSELRDKYRQGMGLHRNSAGKCCGFDEDVGERRGVSQTAQRRVGRQRDDE